MKINSHGEYYKKEEAIPPTNTEVVCPECGYSFCVDRKRYGDWNIFGRYVYTYKYTTTCPDCKCTFSDKEKIKTSIFSFKIFLSNFLGLLVLSMVVTFILGALIWVSVDMFKNNFVGGLGFDIFILLGLFGVIALLLRPKDGGGFHI